MKELILIWDILCVGSFYFYYFYRKIIYKVFLKFRILSSVISMLRYNIFINKEVNLLDRILSIFYWSVEYLLKRMS